MFSKNYGLLYEEQAWQLSSAPPNFIELLDRRCSAMTVEIFRQKKHKKIKKKKAIVASADRAIQLYIESGITSGTAFDQLYDEVDKTWWSALKDGLPAAPNNHQKREQDPFALQKTARPA